MFDHLTAVKGRVCSPSS